MAREAELAYAAGIVDGEGSIYTNLHSKGKRGNHEWWTPRPFLAVQVTDAALVNWLHRTFGGHVTIARRAAPRRREQICWRLGHGEMENFLRQILPYMIIKRAQAERAIEIRVLMRTAVRVGPRGNSLDQPTRDKMSRLRLEISTLNKTGTLP